MIVKFAQDTLEEIKIKKKTNISRIEGDSG